MDLSFAELPQWAGIALAAGIAAVVGAFVGMWVARGRAGGEPRAESDLEDRVDTPIGRENPAFVSLQGILRARGIGAKEQDTRLREFASEYNIIHRKLRELLPIGEGLADSQQQALAALEGGEFEKAITLAEKLGTHEGEEGRRLRERAGKMLQAGATAKVIAADLYMVLMAPENARALYEQAVEELPPTADERRAEVLNKLGTACYQSGDSDNAVKAFTRGLRLLEKTLGNDHPDVATSLNNLALIHYSKGRYDQAEPLYRRALMIDERVLGYDHPGVATDLNNLALLYKKQGNLDAAEPLLKRALSIKERTFDSGHPSLVTGLKNYASLLRSLGRTDEAKAFEDRAASLPPSRTESAA
ncbi:tetratricopeptide repeat protein [Thalassospiraceae bacterium LMO-JJ14]|nr:tetratricopeptide repeat protein [Thalassospiraceae bacterium LMO-JJ14]